MQLDRKMFLELLMIIGWLAGWHIKLKMIDLPKEVIDGMVSAWSADYLVEWF